MIAAWGGSLNLILFVKMYLHHIEMNIEADANDFK